MIDDVKGNWWIMYHSYEKGFQTLGRQTLMLPIEWTKDMWFRVPEGVNSSDNISRPAGEYGVKDFDLSDNFSKDKLGWQWQFFKQYLPSRYEIKNDELVLKATGSSFSDSSPVLVNPIDRSYEIQVEYTIEPGVTAGLCLFYNEQGNVRISADVENLTVFNQRNRKIVEKNDLGSHGFLRIVNDENEVSFYYSKEGKMWNRVERSIDVTGFNHNMFGGFMNLRAGLFAFGEGNVRFDNFIYKKR